MMLTKCREENRSDIKTEVCSMGNCSSAHKCQNRNGIDGWVLVYCWYVHISASNIIMSQRQGPLTGLGY